MKHHLMTALAFLLIGSPSAFAASDLQGALGQEIEREVRLRAQLGDAANINVLQVRVGNDALADRATGVRRIALPTGEDGLGRVAAKALLVTRDGQETWTWVQARVDASVPTVVASRALERGETLSSSDLTTAMLPVHPRQTTQAADTLGFVLKRPVRAGEAIRTSWLTRPMAVKRGDRVETIVQRGIVSARGAAEAMERGRVGDVIRVKVPGTRRVLRARVIDNKQVEVMR